MKNLRKCVFLLTAAAAAAAFRHPAQLLLQHNGRPTLTMPVFSELLFIMSLKDVKRFLKDSMKSASPLFSYNLEGDGEVHSWRKELVGNHAHLFCLLGCFPVQMDRPTLGMTPVLFPLLPLPSTTLLNL